MSGRTPYRASSAANRGRVPYRESGGQRTTRTPFRGGAPTDSAPAPKKEHHGGFLATLKHVVTQTPKDLGNAAYHAPGGVYAAGKAVVDPVYQELRHGPNSPQARKARQNEADLAKGVVKQTVETVKHPLRHPGDTALLFAPGVGRLAKAGEAVSLAKGGASAGKVVRAATVGVKPGPRVLKVGDMEVRGHYSRAAGSRVAQKVTDRMLEKGAKKHVRVENVLHKRAAKWEGRNQRTADAVARAPGTKVAVLGQKLKPHELRALRLVAEETPVERRLGAQHMRQGRAKNPKEHARHQERIDLTKAAMQHLTTDEKGRPVFKPGSHLQNVYRAIEKASADREGILKHLDLMDEASLQASKTKVAQVAAGGTYEKPTPSKLGKSAALDRMVKYRAGVQRRLDQTTTKPRTIKEAQATLAKLENQHNRALDKAAGAMFGPVNRSEVSFRTRENKRAIEQAAGVDSSGRVSGASGAKSTHRKSVTQEMRDQAEKKIEATIRANPNHPIAAKWRERTQEIDKLKAALNPEMFTKVNKRQLGRRSVKDTERAGRLRGALSIADERVAELEKDAAKRVKPTGIVGAEDITASGKAVHIGNPVEKTKLRGNPKVSSTGTIGHTSKPASLKVSTGGSVEHALERNDVTNIVAERHAEAIRLGTVDRVVKKFSKAGEKSPRRKDDVFMWTDKVVANTRIPKEVRDYLDNPESIANLSPDQKASIFDRIRDAHFEKQDWRDAGKVTEFEKLAQQGKGVFVPRRLLGEFGKRSYHLGDNKAVQFADAVNNAQKVGLIYLKLNYPVVQGVSNAAMNIMHQGFAYPRNLTAAIRLEKKMGPDYAAITDDIMGQGAMLQAQLEGHGAVARASHKIADTMSTRVDRPARRAAFYHEAMKAGYKTPERYRALLEDDKHAGDLGEVAQRAREAIVDYGDMGPVEKNIVRRLVFVYPWQKGATKYAGHFLRDHPVQAAVLSQLGELGKKESDKKLGAVPSYLKGIIPVGGGRTVNPAGANYFQTPAQIGTALGGLASGNPAQAGAGLGFLSPAPGIAAGLLSGRDDIGRPLKGNVLAKARDLSVSQMPGSALLRASPAGNTAIAKALIGSQKSSQTFPDANDPYWRFGLGGLYPRKTNKGALNKNAAREKTRR